ncbi:MAG: hypothetical protein QW304_07870 [Thermoproteota archaeon]
MLRKVEDKAYRWLLSQGYKNIVLQPSKSPDFIVDGVGYEVKRGVQLATGALKVLLTARQWNAIKDTNTYILVFRDFDNEPYRKIHVRNIDPVGGRNSVDNVFFHIYGMERVNLVLDADTYKKVMAMCREIDSSRPRIEDILSIALLIRESDPRLWDSYVIRLKTWRLSSKT